MATEKASESSPSDDEVRAAYEEKKVGYETCARKVRVLLSELLDSEGLRIHSVSSRVKELDSLLTKVRKGQGKYRVVDEITDVVGIRVITYFTDEVDRVAEIIERELAVDPGSFVDKGRSLDPDRFGYQSLHYVAVLGGEREGLAEYAAMANIPFEIQVRTILQHAWAEIEHDLGYKSKGEIPRPIRRRFSRLAGLLEMADEEFRAIRDDLQQYSDALPPLIQSAPEQVFIDRDSLQEFLKQSELAQRLSESIADLSGNYLDSNPARLEREAETFTTSLQSFGLETIEDLERELNAHSDLIQIFAELWLNQPEEDEDEDEYDRTFGQGVCLFYLQYVLASESGVKAVQDYIERSEIRSTEGPEELAEEVVAWMEAARDLLES